MPNPSAPEDRAGSAADPVPSPADTPPEEEAPKPPVRLLLVDDEPGLRTAVKAYLEDEGFEVNTANDGERAGARPSCSIPMWSSPT